jgi:hypothetical protein
MYFGLMSGNLSLCKLLQSKGLDGANEYTSFSQWEYQVRSSLSSSHHRHHHIIAIIIQFRTNSIITHHHRVHYYHHRHRCHHRNHL